MKRTLITSALPYANGYLHLGHVAGSFLPADLYARFMRLSGEKVLYVCGSDEYGVAISIAAEKEGVTPKDIIDKYHNANSDALSSFGMSYDIYSRTSIPRHVETTQEFFTDLLAKGYLAEKEEAQFYDADANMFLPDRYVEGTCPNCGYDKARGDQCDKCGAYYNQLDLKNPRSLVSGKTPVVKNTTHWYFKLGDFQQMLEEFITRNAATWKDNVVQQSRSWLNQGLSDRAITRDLTWGVPVPLERAKGKVIYVWFDAVLGYISATKEWAAQNGKPEEWRDWWTLPNGKTQEEAEMRYIAFLGKDNIVFHAIMFPAMLYGRGNYVLPTNVPANEFLNLEGEKFSKSRNWAIDLRDYFKDFPEAQHADALRYTLAMNMPENKDSDFTWRDFQARVNNELAAILGNFVNRSAQFLHKNFDGRVPHLPEAAKKLPEAWKLLVGDIVAYNVFTPDEAIEHLHPKYLHYFSQDDVRLLASLTLHAKRAAENYTNFRFRDAVTETMNIARAANKYFNDTAPWKSIKENRDDAAKALYICSQLLRSLAIAFQPILPNTSAAILQMLGAEAKNLTQSWQTLAHPLLPEGAQTLAPTILFSKVEDEIVAREIAKLGRKDNTGMTNDEAKTAPSTNDQAPTNQATKPQPTNDHALISIDDFKNIQLRTGKILVAERVPKSEKLVKLQVDIGSGTETRQILAGIGKFYTPEELVGKVVTVLVNLKAAKLMGQESQGMLLAANMPDGSLSLVTPEKAGVEAGAEVR
ncbi:MAG: methionine--tRNA ligase [Candidatus Kapaibacterium sp.]|nr:MAG: methionine--tRNA ligase [Candidatus Kapabacteria bacterium]